MRTKSLFGLSSILALGLAACSGSETGNTDSAYVPPVTYLDAGAIDTTPAIDTAAPPAPVYTWVVIQDTEQNACNTTGPGVDVDAVTVYDATGPLGWGKPGTATYTPNGIGACPAGTCGSTNSSPCKYAANGGVFTEADLVSRTEGPADAQVLAVGDDTGYFALNAGTLQLQIGAGATGTGAPMQLKKGDFIKVYEVDKSYVESGAAYSGCTCQPDHYTVSLQTSNPADPPLKLTPAQLDPASTTCTPLTSASLEGCGSTIFMVP